MEREQTVGEMGLKEQRDGFPFEIRAHHILLLSIYLRSGKSAIDDTRDFFMLAEPVRSSRPNSKIVKGSDKWFYNDILGNTQSQVDRYIRHRIEFLEEFSQLSLDYPVRLNERKKDKICNGCAIGEHCKRNGEAHADRALIRVFRKAAKRLGLEDKIDVTKETIIDYDGKPRKLTSILTTAGAVREVINETRFSFVKFFWAHLMSW